jgi:hypothetical protein
MNENYSSLQDTSRSKLVIKDNNITHNVPELDELNQNSEKLTNSMMFRYNLRVYVIYAFQIISIILFILMIGTSELTFYLSLMFFFCFETWIITMNCIGVDEYKILKMNCVPLNQLLEEYFYDNNISIEYYAIDWCTGFKRVGISLPVPCQSCLDISGLFSMNSKNNEDNYFILYIKKQVKFIGDSNLINMFFKSINEGFEQYDNDSCIKIKKEINIGDTEKYCVKTAINDPPYKFYVRTGANNPPSKYGFLGTIANFIGLGGVYLFYLRNFILRKDFMVKKVISSEDLETLKQRYQNTNPGILINNNRYMFDIQKIGKNVSQQLPENFKLKIY